MSRENRFTGDRTPACRPAGRSGRLTARLTALLAVLAGLAGLACPAGCAGYRIGNQSLYATDVRTVYVPIAESSSFRRHLGERLTEAVIKEIELRTPYKATGDSNADSVLTIRIVGDRKKVVVESRNDEPRDVEVALHVQASWLDRQGNLLRQSQPVPLPLELISVTESATLVPEVGQSVATGHQKAIQRMAQQIVAMMEAPW